KDGSMHPKLPIDKTAHPVYISTGHLPSAELVASLVAEAHERFKSHTEGKNSQVYPALASVPSELFGVCLVGTNGKVHMAGDAEYEFTIMSVSKPFVFALVCQELGPEEARQKLGVNATGLAFNSLAAIERNPDGKTNPMVNAGAIATTSLVPGGSLEAKWKTEAAGIKWKHFSGVSRETKNPARSTHPACRSRHFHEFKTSGLLAGRLRCHQSAQPPACLRRQSLFGKPVPHHEI